MVFTNERMTFGKKDVTYNVPELQKEMFSINMILNHTITYISNSLQGL